MAEADVLMVRGVEAHFFYNLLMVLMNSHRPIIGPRYSPVSSLLVLLLSSHLILLVFLSVRIVARKVVAEFSRNFREV